MNTIEESLRAIFRDEVRGVVREELRAVLPSLSQDKLVTIEFLSTTQAAELIGVRAATIRAWIQQDKLKAYRAGRALRIQRDELLALMSSESANSNNVNIDERASSIVMAASRNSSERQA